MVFFSILTDTCNHHHQFFKTFMISKRIPKPFSYHLLLCHLLFLHPSLPSPKQSLIYFLCLQIFLFWTFHINEIVQYVAFCDWLISYSTMLLRFIHFVTCITILFFLWLNNIVKYPYYILCIHLSSDGNLGCLYLLGTMNKAAMNIHLQVLMWPDF